MDSSHLAFHDCVWLFYTKKKHSPRGGDLNQKQNNTFPLSALILCVRFRVPVVSLLPGLLPTRNWLLHIYRRQTQSCKQREKNVTHKSSARDTQNLKSEMPKVNSDCAQSRNYLYQPLVTTTSYELVLAAPVTWH